jgi:competence protein ComEA
MSPGHGRDWQVGWQALAVMVVLMLLGNFISGAWFPASAFAAPTAGPEADKTEEPAPDDGMEAGTTSAAAPKSKAKSKKGTAKKKLEKLPGIGPKRAQAIIKGRPYKSPQGIMQVRGIKKGTYRKLQKFITVK